MQKATRFSKTEVILVAVNSIITKLFLIFPATVIQIGGSASIILSLYISLIGYLILLFITILYKKFGNISIIKITENTFGKYFSIIYAFILAIIFVLINGMFLRCVSESISLSLMPETNVSIISLIFIIGVTIAAFSGLKAIVRCHAVIVPLTLFVVAILFAGSVSTFDYSKIFPLLGNGSSVFSIGALLCSYFSDYFVILFILPYVQKGVKLSNIITKTSIISALVLIFIISAVLLSVDNSTVIPVFKLAQNFELFGYTPRLESIFTAAWFLSFYLNFSLLQYFSCRLFCHKHNYKAAIIPLSIIVFVISIIPKTINDISKVLDYLSLARLVAFFAFPIIILAYSNFNTRRS